jgi:hypothetical protein
MTEPLGEVAERWRVMGTTVLAPKELHEQRPLTR